jgi:hypothetical protein
MNNYEYFQDDASIDEAYNSAKLDQTSNNIPYCEPKKKIEKSTISNLWSFLGLTSLSNEKQGCLFDCSIDGTRCLEKCPENSNKCNYKCLKHGINCSKKCIISEPPTPKKTEKVNVTTSSNNTNDNIVNFPSGNKTYFDNYAPFDSKLWPGYNQTGWDLEKLENHSTNDLIEVLVPNQFPSETPKPNLLF